MLADQGVISYTEPMERLNLYPNEFNFRDLGGYPTRDGKVVKKGVFYRSGGLFYLNEEDLNRFEREGIPYILDLRTKAESDSAPDPVMPGVVAIRHSGVVSKGGEEIDFSPAGMSLIGEEGYRQIRNLQNYYAEMPFGNEAFRIFFKEIEKEHTPILFHCATGKDRTGVLAMILLLALNVDEETIFEDYMLSVCFRREHLERALAEQQSEINEHPERKELIIMKEAVSEEVGRLVLAEIHKRYASVEQYLETEFGLTEEKRKRLRDRYTE